MESVCCASNRGFESRRHRQIEGPDSPRNRWGVRAFVNLRGKTVDLSARMTTVNGQSVFDFNKKATGSAIRGPGTGTSDSIPAMLSNGEHVITAAEVKAAGGHGVIEDWREQLLRGGSQPLAPITVAPSRGVRAAAGDWSDSGSRTLGAFRGGDVINNNDVRVVLPSADPEIAADLFAARLNMGLSA